MEDVYSRRMREHITVIGHLIHDEYAFTVFVQEHVGLPFAGVGGTHLRSPFLRK